jgi:hypothetical protein
VLELNLFIILGNCHSFKTKLILVRPKSRLNSNFLLLFKSDRKSGNILTLPSLYLFVCASARVEREKETPFVLQQVRKSRLSGPLGLYSQGARGESVTVWKNPPAALGARISLF